ncbi:MAG: 30S ribosomal protein S17 [Planctomycetota bacterium]|nr:MAG: 30S ribosomal protein S17 [Planctomycetota bacterium]
MSGTTETASAASASDTKRRGERRRFEGVVTSAKMDKTITVQHSYLRPHPKYGKYVRRYTKLKAHDEKNEAREGDLVEIAETRPLSKTKRYRLVRIVRRAAK